MTAALLAALLTADPAPALAPAGRLSVIGDLKKSEDLSAAGRVGEFLLLASDETDHVAVLRVAGDAARVVGEVRLGAKGDEIDLEGIACDGDIVYAAGSHAGKRPKADPRRVTFDPARDAVYRFRLKPDGTAGTADKVNLRNVIEAEPALAPFAKMPAKEGGVDIEGLAVKGGVLYAGFRGPVPAGGPAAVLAFRFDDPAGSARLLRLPLGGLGVRDLCATAGGILVLAGPVGSADAPFRLYAWDGGDRVDLLGELPARRGEHPEAVLLTGETAAGYDVLVVSDGVRGGNPTRYRVPRPR